MQFLIFDSGIGGLGVAQHLRALMPHAAATYLMDDAGFPYGARTEADLTSRVARIVGAGIECVHPDVVVVACNTASTAALAGLRASYAVPFVGCVPPVKMAAAASRTGTIGVLATPATVAGSYLRALADRHAPGMEVLIHGAAGLAALAERDFAGDVVRQDEVVAELAALLGQDSSHRIDAIALGCTHYARLLPMLRQCMDSHVTWHDPAAGVARQAARIAAALPPGHAPGGAAPDGVVLHTGKRLALRGFWAAAGYTVARHLPAAHTV